MLKMTSYFPALLFQMPAMADGGSPALLGPVIWIALMAVAFVLLRKNKMTKTYSTILLLISFVVGGIMFGASPNPVMPFFEIIMGLTADTPMPQRIQSVIPTLIILGLLLLSGYFLGRIFCGYACPLGAIQELMSKLRFKTKASLKRTPEQVKSRRKRSDLVRWIVFVIYMVGVAILGLQFAKMTNPFIGFQAIKNKNISMLIIPFILLVVTIVASIFVYRPYCRYFCPYGAVAAKINSGKKTTIQFGNSCKTCGLCERVCPTDSMDRDADKSECYYCGRCVDVCPMDCIELLKT